MVCSIWKHIAARKSGDGIANHPEHKVKRACFTLGIGRELYTAPRIFIYADKCAKIQQGKNGKMQCYDRFRVERVRIEDGRITGLAIWNDTTGHRCFVWTKEVKDGE